MFRALRSGDAATRRPVLILAAGFAVLIVVALLSAWAARNAREQNERVEHTMLVLVEAGRLLQALTDAETGQRGYLLAGGETYLARHRAGMADTPRTLARVESLTRDNPRQVEALRAMHPLIQERLNELRRTVGLYEAGRAADALAVVRTHRGKQLMDDLRGRIAAVQAEESRLLGQRRDAAARIAQQLLALSVGGLVLAALLGLAAIMSMLRYARGMERANATVRSLNEGLEDKVAERTSDLLAANDEIQRFAYIVSHDLRSPLVNVMGFTAELEAAGGQARDLLDKADAQGAGLVTREHRAAVTEDLPEAIGFIRTSTAKMDRLINAILKLSREGRRTLSPEQVDLTRLAEDVAASLRRQADVAGATIAIDPLPSVTSDRLALDQVFGNLVENAVKYLSPDRPGKVRVSGKSLGSLVEITIEDNGRGIDKADQERVFDLFRRAGAQDRPGEGIGLAHARALVRRLGGTIALESELGRGSRFTVTLPREMKGSAGDEGEPGHHRDDRGR